MAESGDLRLVVSEVILDESRVYPGLQASMDRLVQKLNLQANISLDTAAIEKFGASVEKVEKSDFSKIEDAASSFTTLYEAAVNMNSVIEKLIILGPGWLSWISMSQQHMMKLTVATQFFAYSLGMGTTATRIFTAAVVGLTRAFLPLAVITGISYAVSELIGHFQRAKKAQQEFEQQQQSIADNWSSNKDQITELVGLYEELDAATRGGTKFESADQEAKYKDTVEQLSKLMPSLVKSVDAKGNAHLKNIQAMKDEIAYAEKLEDLQNREKVMDAEKTFKGNIKDVGKIEKKIKANQGDTVVEYSRSFSVPYLRKLTDSEMNDRQKELASYEYQLKTATNQIRQEVGSVAEAMMEINNVELSDTLNQELEKLTSNLDVEGLDEDALMERSTAIAQFFETLSQMKYTDSAATADAATQSLYGFSDTIGLTKTKIDEMIASVIEMSKANNEASQAAFNLEEATKGIYDSMGSTVDSIESLQDVYGQLSQGQSLSLDTIVDLVAKHPELASALQTENGILKLNQNAVEELAVAKEISFKNELASRKLELESAKNTLIAKLQIYSGEVDALEKLDKARYLANAKTIPEAQFLEEQFKEFKKIQDQINAIDALGKTDFRKTLNAAKSDDKKKASPAASKVSTMPEPQLEEAIKLQELTKEQINAYNEKYNISLKNIEALDRQIKTAEKANGQAKVVELTNKKIREQTAAVTELKKAQQDFHKEADQIRSKRPDLDTETWFDANGEKSKAFIMHLNGIAQKSEDIRKNDNLTVEQRNDQIKKLKEEQELLETMFEKLYEYKQAWKENADAIQQMNDNLDASKETLQEIKKEADKKVYEQLRDKELQVIEDQIDAEDKRHKARMDHLDEEMSKYEDSINQIRKSLDREWSTDDFNDSLSELQKEAQAILDLRNQYSLDDSFEGKRKKQELDEQYAEKQEEIAKLNKDRNRELREDDLDDLLETKKKEIETQRETEDKLFEINKENLDRIKTEITAFWETTINDETTYLKSQSEVIAAHLAEVEGSLRTFYDKASEISKSIGSDSAGISMGIADTLKSGLTGAVSQVPSPSYLGLTEEQETIRQQMEARSRQWAATSDPSLRNQLAMQNKVAGYQIGAVRDEKTGVWTKNGYKLFHNGGEVGIEGSTTKSWLQKILGSHEVPAILKKGEVVLDQPIQFLREIAGRIVRNVATGMPLASAAAGAGGNQYNIDVRIDKVTGGQEGADQMWSAIKRGLKTGRYN